MHRPAAVAGTFYPADPTQLRAQIDGFLAAAAASSEPRIPKALIAPHAGTIYSGPVAASAYRLLAGAAGQIARVVLLGPSHRVPFHGLAIPSVEAFDTPLGPVAIDRAACANLLALPQVHEDDEPHRREHSLEVHLPFLQRMLERFTLVPLAVGSASAEEVAAVLRRAWGGPETLIVISSDLSHYLPYEQAQRVDAETRRAIEDLEPERLDGERACGYHALRGLLLVARERGLAVRTLDLRSSGDTSGSRDQVVGYGSWAVA